MMDARFSDTLSAAPGQADPEAGPFGQVDPDPQRHVGREVEVRADVGAHVQVHVVVILRQPVVVVPAGRGDHGQAGVDGLPSTSLLSRDG